MELGVFGRGLLIGLSIAAPVGPIGVLCIHRTLAEGRLAGLATGLGAATADALYGVVAAFGITAIANLLVGYQGAIRLVGGLFLCYLGLRTFLSSPTERAATAAGQTLLGAYGSALALTLTNPLTILSFAAIFAGAGIAATPGAYDAAALLVLGVLLGSAAWWLILSGAVAALRGRLTGTALCWINHLSGLVLLVFGVLALVSLR
ncbi:MAG TPA: LysE family transporter [Thermomicrobiales bacterium]|jgi:threonine/homoserine/homoserine lactone efflux protein